MRISNDEVISEGNLGKVFSTTFRLAAEDMTSIGYYDGGEGGTGGMYVRSGWANSCLIPNISRELVDSMIDVIARRFPTLPTEHSESLKWRGEKLIELGLSKLNRGDSDTKS